MVRTLFDVALWVSMVTLSVCADCRSGVISRLTAIPGKGWDNLKNEEKASVFDQSYTSCNLTEDGKYLIPDVVEVLSYPTALASTTVEIFDNWDNFIGVFSRSLNMDGHMENGREKRGSLHGKYSQEFRALKIRMYKRKSIAVRVQKQSIQYRAVTAAKAPLARDFRDKLVNIGLLLALDKTRIARYMAQRLVRDFGTHVIKEVDVGTSLLQTSFVPKSSAGKLGLDVLKKEATSAFGIRFRFAAGTTQSTTKAPFSKDITDSDFRSLKDFQEETTYAAFTALDRKGIPIYKTISPETMPHVPGSILQQIQKTVQVAVEQYYGFNIRRGCTNPDAPNFSFLANVDDDSCQLPTKTFPFGGVYQVCNDTGTFNICSNHSVKNVVTNDFTCGESFSPVLLDSKGIEESQNVSECRRCWLIFRCCDPKTETAQAFISAYWCAAKPSAADSGFQFGGLFSSNIPNVLTLDMYCPQGFFPSTILEDLSVCISNRSVDNIEGDVRTVPFAGFFSCREPNPYVENSGSSQCPSGYSTQLAKNGDDCDIQYCIQASKSNATTLPEVRKPPFMPVVRLMQSAIRKPEYVVDIEGSIHVSLAVVEKLQWVQEIKQSAPDVTPSDTLPEDTDFIEITATARSLEGNDNESSALVVLMCWGTTGVILFTIGWILCRVKNKEKNKYVKV